MSADQRMRPNWDWVWRLLPSVLILSALWFAHGRLIDKATETWKVNLFWSVVALGFLDLAQAIRLPLSRFAARTRWQRRERSKQRAPAAELRSPGATVDRPVTSLADDQLGFAKYAFILARSIVSGDTPMTLGIHGEWGCGKSSLANMIRHFLTPRDEATWANEKLRQIREELAASGLELDKQLPNESLQKLEIIDLNAWQYASSQSLWRALILRLSQRLEEKGLAANSDEWQQRLYYSVSQDAKGEIRLSNTALITAAVQALAVYLGSLVLPSTWLLLALRATGARPRQDSSPASFDDLYERQKYTLMRKQMESIEEFQSALRQLVDRLLERRRDEPRKDGKVVFFIDDLDRCLPTVALEIMETIKTFLDVPGCVYVLLCDQQLLGQGVKAKFRELFSDQGDAYQRRGREYTEKIIQVSFHIPPTNRDQLERFAAESLRDQSGDWRSPYFEVVYATVADNLRKVKRLYRGLEIAFDMMQLTLGRPVHPPVPPDASTSPAAEEKSVLERKREFAKVYCLQYGWPEAVALLRDYQVRGRSDPPPVPAGVAALMAETDQEKLNSEHQNLLDAFRLLNELLSASENNELLSASEDLRIFSPLLVSVDWGKASVSGDGAVERHNLDLWRFVRTEPYFTRIALSDLKDYIEWSGILAGEERPDRTPNEPPQTVEPENVKAPRTDVRSRHGSSSPPVEQRVPSSSGSIQTEMEKEASRKGRERRS